MCAWGAAAGCRPPLSCCRLALWATVGSLPGQSRVFMCFAGAMVERGGSSDDGDSCG
eukprot:XP_001700190.1 predicted protein [Chlamydomonas reinhardtii]